MSTTNSSMIPLPLIALHGVGGLLLAAGLLGLFAPEVVPPLARPAVAYALIGVGLLLDTVAVVSIVKTLRRRRG